MAEQITYENLFSESRANVVALITTTNIPDSTISSSEYRKRIYSREPKTKSNDFKGFPYLVVHPADVDIEREESSLDGKSKNVYWDIEVEIVTSDRGYGEKNGEGLTHMETISNNLIKTFMNNANRNTLRSNFLKFINVTTTSVGTEIIEDELVYRRSIMISFRNRIKVCT